tara:strand:- start:16061 stop:16501 length:441 start_codon:yes stop_codon:yes gene_type:complete
MYSILMLDNGVELPKQGREKLQKYSSVLLRPDFRNKYQGSFTTHEKESIPPLAIKIGDIFKVGFAGGTAGFLVNEIYADAGNHIRVKGCRWHLINSPEKKRWWAKNNMLVEYPQLYWENLHFPNNRLREIKAPLSEQTEAYLKGKL